MNKGQLVCLLVAFVSYALSLVFSYLNTAGVKALFYNNNGNLDRKYFQQVSPSGIAFGIIWPIIYIWNLAGVLYLLISCCLPVAKSPVLMEPTLVPKKFLLAYSVTFLTTVGWLFAFDREILGLSLALLVVGVASAYVALGVSYTVVFENAAKLGNRSKAVLLPMRILIHNGFGILATWLTVATLLNLADVIIYKDSFDVTPAIERGLVSVVTGSTIILAILLALIIAWFVLENFVWEKYCRWTFTIYPVLILALSALIAKLRPLDDARQNLIFASVNLGVVVVAFIARIILTVYRATMRSHRAKKSLCSSVTGF